MNGAVLHEKCDMFPCKECIAENNMCPGCGDYMYDATECSSCVELMEAIADDYKKRNPDTDIPTKKVNYVNDDGMIVDIATNTVVGFKCLGCSTADTRPPGISNEQFVDWFIANQQIHADCH